MLLLRKINLRKLFVRSMELLSDNLKKIEMMPKERHHCFERPPWSAFLPKFLTTVKTVMQVYGLPKSDTCEKYDSLENLIKFKKIRKN